ncbi:hypothetical protein [Falsirhodobacter algicola]|uniref:Lipoprotein n=1 Tax=Falsirhodobacter algicola TaxID=2692330 RepID=A0A8J8SKQ2_9RHOB|nr:hypothetical protein [Falsirhodobacter algicola]QUS35593.1 hypothetical protein GR316_04500 [Falsirhodobacter algicola]
MTRCLFAILIASTALVGCSRLNPATWSGGSSAPAPVDTPAPKVDERPLIAQVTELEVDRTGGGAIIRATGLAPTQGWYDAALVPVETTDGTLRFAFRAAPPASEQPVGPAATREIVVATAVDAATLSRAGRITVQGATNALSR